MAMSTYLANAILDLTLRGVAFVPPTNVYVSLHTADPGLTGANEVSAQVWTGYARCETSGGAGIAQGFSEAADKSTGNTRQLLFPANNGESKVTVTHFGLWDAAEGGHFLYGDTMQQARDFNPTDEAVLYPNRLTVTVT
jgi:hypothetical protein